MSDLNSLSIATLLIFSNFLLCFSNITDNLVSELTFKYDVMCGFINMDETRHVKSSSGDKGGTRTTTLTNPNIPRSASRYVKDSGNHTIGC